MTRIATEELLDRSKRLHSYLLKNHWNGKAITGPDPGIRFNARIGRFLKNYLSFIPWSDNLFYMQAQGYWILDNLLMADLLNDAECERIALECAEYILSVQQPAGYWDHPNPEWKGRIATVEGCFAAIGLIEGYARSQREHLLVGAKKWFEYMMNEVGFFEPEEGMLAVRYFSNVPTGMVPNNSTLVLQMLARLAEVTHDDQFLQPCQGMVAWLNHAQVESGELPYAVGVVKGGGRPHFLCYQYNSFEFLDLVHYYQITGDKGIWPVIERLAGYLSTGLADGDHACYDCQHPTPDVTYYTLALGRALSEATALGIGDFQPLADRAYNRVLSEQKEDGAFQFYSQKNYGLLSDSRSYPRYLSMILNHLLQEHQTRMPIKTDTPADVG